MSSGLGPVFTAGGLISGIDTNSMIDKLTSLEAIPIGLMQRQQAALTSQVSTLGGIASSLSSLNAVATGLASSGITAATASTTSTDFTATAGAGAIPGRHTMSVQGLATGAMMRSQAFASGMSPVRGGTLQLSVGGAAATVTMTDGMQLGDVAKAINATGLRVSATVLGTGSNTYLAVNALDTGFDPASTPASALQITETSTGTQGVPLGATTVTAAANAQFTVDGLAFTRQSNLVNDAIPGLTLALSKTGAATADLVVSTDVAGSQRNLQRFVDGFNQLLAQLNASVAPSPGADPNRSLSGDDTARSLQNSLRSISSAQIPGATGAVRSLADLGVKANHNDGTLSIDADIFAKALTADPNGVKNLFATASSGVAAQMKTLTTRFTDPIIGSIPLRTAGMQTTITDLDNSIAHSQIQVDALRAKLVTQFSAMESILSRLKTQGSYLTQAFANMSSSGKQQ